jgi:hypothetical protein
MSSLHWGWPPHAIRPPETQQLTTDNRGGSRSRQAALRWARGHRRLLIQSGGRVLRYSKRLGLLHELIPRATTVGVLLNPNNPPADGS